ncbi:MAG: sugar phosphate isomerase/epimerase family protein [Butyricicoccaceae bacterium]
MKLGISTACFYPTPIEKGIEIIAELGFKNIEVFVNAQSEYREPFCSAYRQRLEALGLNVLSLHPFSSGVEGLYLFSDYERRVDDTLDDYERYCACAAQWGARMLTFHGERNIPLGLPRVQDNWERRFEIYHRLCERAARWGITIAQENVAWCKSREPAFLRRLYENLPELRFTLDLKQAERAGHDWNEYIDAVGDRIVNLHISDHSPEKDCMLPGAGTVRFDELFARMNSLGYDGAALIEVYDRDFQELRELSASLAYLNNLIQE